MLRILFISLVIANLLLLAFQSDKPAVPSRTTATRPDIKDTGIPTIHLFSEMMEDQGLMSSNRQCFTLGPFHASEDKDEVRTRLLEVTTNISERQTEALVEKGYWVFMPPYASPLEANKALFSLQALGLEDVAIMYDGDRKNAISLGYFLRQENAQRRKKDLEDRGFPAKMRIQRQAEPRYWLDYEQVPGSGLIALDMQNRPNDFMQRPVPCPEQDFAEDTGGALPAPEQVAQIVAETVSQAPAQKSSEDTVVATSKPEQDKSADAGAVSQPTEKAKPEETVVTSSTPEQDKPADAGAVSQSPEEVRPKDTVVNKTAPEQDKSEDAVAVSQSPEEVRPKDAVDNKTAPEQDKSEDTNAVSKPTAMDKSEVALEATEAIDVITSDTEQAIPEVAADIASKSSEQADIEVAGADSKDPEQTKPEDTAVTSQAPAEYLPRPQASAEDNGTDPDQGEDTGAEKAVDDAPAQSDEASPDQAVEPKAETDGENGTVEG